MRAVLINPPWAKRRGNLWRHVAGVVPNMGLAALAAFARRAGHEVEIVDAAAEGLDAEQVARRTAGAGLDVIGISASTSVFPAAVAVAERLARAHPEAQVVFGGAHPTALPDQVLACRWIDAVVRGEGEETFAELLDGRPLHQIPGLSFRADGQVVHNPDRPLLDDLDRLPLPAYDLLPMSAYRPPLGGYLRLPAVAMITSRGCPGRCTFCFHRMWRGKVRCRSPEKVVEEMMLLASRYRVREISFYDDTFTARRGATRELCRRLIQAPHRLTWSCEARADVVDAETLSLMAQAGCHQICFGAESASDEILRRMNKRVDRAGVERAVRLTQQAGIRARAAFMLGSPGETERSLRATLRYAIELRPDVVQFNITTPFPGTELYDWAVREGALLSTDWSRYDHAHGLLDLPEAPPELVERCYRQAHRSFYLRPAYLLRRLRDIRSWRELTMNLRALVAIAQRT
jgi:radical SAM superfamily enzyme YgiQ (UPF0313 family)